MLVESSLIATFVCVSTAGIGCPIAAAIAFGVSAEQSIQNDAENCQLGWGTVGKVALDALLSPPGLGIGKGLTTTTETAVLREAAAAKSTTPLDWASVVPKSGETRLSHVALHETPNPGKIAHGVFNGDSVAITNEAWGIAQSRGMSPFLSKDGVDIYRVPMGRNVGYAGGGNATELAGVPHNTVEIIVRRGTNQLITAYPVPL